MIKELRIYYKEKVQDSFTEVVYNNITKAKAEHISLTYSNKMRRGDLVALHIEYEEA